MSVQPAHVKLSIWKGADFSHRFVLLTAGEGSSPVDVSGYTGSWVIKDKPEGTVLFTYTSPTNIVFGGNTGTIDLKIDDTITVNYAWTTGVYELFVTSTVPQTDVIVFGPIVVKDI